MKVFITGGSGFIGRHLVRKCIQRGYDVYGLAHTNRSAVELEELGAIVVPGDILQRDSMREGMADSDLVFHLAGWYKLGSADWMKAEALNVAGTRNVLRLAYELGVPKIIYTSTTTVFGDTRGQMVDENFIQGGPFLTEYDRTKWLAHYKVAQPLIDQGAPITIIMPGLVYGPGDHSLMGQLMTLFYQGRLLAIPGPEFVHTYAHVEDVAEGHLLAADKGKTSESYIISGPAVPLGEVVDFWGQLTGKPVPTLRVPARFLAAIAPILGVLASILPLPSLFSEEGARVLSATYMARSDKARTELGWRTRSMQEGMSETFRAIAGTTPLKRGPSPRQRKVAGLALLLAAVLLFLWLLERRNDQ